MGSPEPQSPNKSNTGIIASIGDEQQSAVFLDSPIFNYINNLSPIKPVKGTSEVQVFPAFNSPPRTSQKRIHIHRPSCDLVSSERDIPSQEDKNTTGPNLESSSLINTQNTLTKMTDPVNIEGSMETFDNEDDNVLAAPALVEQAQDDHETDGNNRSCLRSNVDLQYDQQLAAQVGRSQLGKRKRLQFESAQDLTIKNDHRSPNPSNTAAISEVIETSISQTTKASSVNVSKPSGIGLHLNSIVNAMPLTYLSGAGKAKKSISPQMQDNMPCPSVSSNSNLVENVSATSEEYAHQTVYSNAESMKMIEYQEKFDSLNSQQDERDDVNRRTNPKKKRKKTESSGDGCKYCNCKKTKCLKLYCDCFAAGIYCADSCSCQGCFNRPEYVSTVLEARQQIESRDPLAFAPKIIEHSKQPPRSQILEDGDQVTPLAGRHKRGCNCKKSMCMKKYCECYQASVGCSEGCRCEGCQNIYGIRGVSSMVRETVMESVNEHVSHSFDDKKLKVGPIKSRSSLPEFHKLHNLAPQTPSFQCSTHENATSPESECPQYVTTPTPKSPNESYPNGEFMDEFSPGDWSTTSRAQLPPTRVRFSSLGFNSCSVTPVSLFGGAKPSFNIIDDDTPNIPKVKVASSSPNKKRVSPPRIRLHELGSSSLKSGRKFILKAVPSFPPLTPCLDSKQTSNQPPPDKTRSTAPF